ncbi:MAG: RodZ domain-containing protein [Microcystaceae cyanobacterium]
MTYYNPEQAAQLKDIGQYLRQQRIYHKFTLEDITEQTFIRLSVLQALEEGDIARLPEKVYVQGFIRRYADLLGLDSQELVKTLSEIPNELPMAVASESSQAKAQAIATLASQTSSKSNTQTLDPPQSQRTPSSGSKPSSSKKGNPLPLLLGLAIVAGLGGYWFMFASEPSSNPTVEQEAPKVTEKVESSPKPVAEKAKPSPEAKKEPSTVAQTVKPSPTPSVSPIPSPVVSSDVSLALDVTITSDSWLKVVTDGQTAYEGILKKGEEKKWEADNAIEIRAGNAGGVQIGLNGASPEPLGELGKIKEATFKAETLE